MFISMNLSLTLSLVWGHSEVDLLKTLTYLDRLSTPQEDGGRVDKEIDQCRRIVGRRMRKWIDRKIDRI